MLLCLSALSAQEPAPQPAFIYRAKVDHVIDGDTISFDVSLGFNVWIHDQSIRLLGVSAPETRSGTAEEKAKGQAVKSFVLKAIETKEAIVIQTHKDKTDKYGRYLGTIWIGGENLNKKILEFMEKSGISQSGKGTK